MSVHASRSVMAIAMPFAACTFSLSAARKDGFSNAPSLPGSETTTAKQLSGTVVMCPEMTSMPIGSMRVRTTERVCG